MIYVVVESKKGFGWIEIMQCSQEADAKKMVEGLYLESKERNENREFKYVELPGQINLPEEKPRKKLSERLEEKAKLIIPFHGLKKG